MEGGDNTTGANNIDTQMLKLEFFINYRLNRMVTFKEDKDWWRYFVNFEAVYNRLLPHMDPDERMEQECEWRLLYYNLKKVEDDTGLNKSAKEEKKNEMYRDFTMAHLGFLFLVFPKAGLSITTDDGEIDFNKISFDTLKQIVRSGAGTPVSVERAIAAETKRDDKIAAELNGSAGKPTG
jgi:hypothetical protein